MSKCIMKLEELNSEIKKVFGSSYIVKSVKKLIGGAQKGTFKVTCNNEFKFILYIWDKCYDNFFEGNNRDDEMTSNSAVLFLKNGKMLKENNIGIQKVFYSDISKEKYSFQFAFVQYVETVDLEAIVSRRDDSYKKIFENLNENLQRLHSITSTKAGDLINIFKEMI